MWGDLGTDLDAAGVLGGADAVAEGGDGGACAAEVAVELFGSQS